VYWWNTLTNETTHVGDPKPASPNFFSSPHHPPPPHPPLHHPPLHHHHHRADQVEIERNKRLNEASHPGIIVQMWEHEGRDFNQINRATAVKRLSQLAQHYRQDVRRWVRILTWIVDDAVQVHRRSPTTSHTSTVLGIRQVSNMLHALAKLTEVEKQEQDQETEEEISRSIRNAAGQLLSIFGEFLNHHDGADKTTTGTCQDYANVVWSMGKLKMTPYYGRLLPDLLAALCRRLDHIKSQDVGNVFWSLGAMGSDVLPLTVTTTIRDGVLASSLALVSRLATTTTLRSSAEIQHLTNTLWAIASLQDGHLPQSTGGLLGQACTPFAPVLVTELVHRPQHQLMTAKPKELVNAIWSCAKLVEEGDVWKRAPATCSSSTTSSSSPDLSPAKAAMRLIDILLHPARQGGRDQPKPHRLNEQDITNTVWSLGTLCRVAPVETGVIAAPYFDSLLAHWSPRPRHPVGGGGGPASTVPHRQPSPGIHLTARQLGNCIWGLGAAGHSGAGATVLLRYLGPLVNALCWTITRMTTTTRETVDTQTLGNTLWALGSLHTQSSTPYGLGRVLSPGDLNALKDVHLPCLLDRLLARITQGTPQQVANGIWAFGALASPFDRTPAFSGSLSLPSLPLLERILIEFEERMLLGKAAAMQNLSNIIWALATVAEAAASNRTPKLSTRMYLCADRIVREMLTRLTECTLQNLSNTIWGLGKLDDANVKGFSLAATPRETGSNNSTTAPTTTTTTSSIYRIAALFDAFMDLASDPNQQGANRTLNPQHLSNVALGLGYSRTLPDLSRIASFVRQFASFIHLPPGSPYRATPQHMANALWGLASAGYIPPEASHTGKEPTSGDTWAPIYGLISRFHEQEKRDQTTSGTPPPPPPPGGGGGGGASPAILSQHVLNTMWAANVMGFRDEIGWRGLCELCNRFEDDQERGEVEWTTVGLCQLWQVSRHVPILRRRPEKGGVGRKLLLRALEAWNLRMEHESVTEAVSYGHKRVLALVPQALERVHFPVKAETLVEYVEARLVHLEPEEDGQVHHVLRELSTPMDIAIIYDRNNKAGGQQGEKAKGEENEEEKTTNSSSSSSLKIAIEVDGPTHFLRNHPGRCDGVTALRNRDLAKRGWSLISIDLQQPPWVGLTNDNKTTKDKEDDVEEERIAWLVERIETILHQV